MLADRSQLTAAPMCADADITRVSKVTAIKNPVPSTIRRMLSMGPDFSFRITEQWWRGQHDVEHPLSMVTESPILPDTILVSGSEWLEPAAAGQSGCTICFLLRAQVRVAAVGGTIARGVLDGALKGYANVPRLALEYVEMQRMKAAAVAPSQPEAMATQPAKPTPQMPLDAHSEPRTQTPAAAPESQEVVAEPPRHVAHVDGGDGSVEAVASLARRGSVAPCAEPRGARPQSTSFAVSSVAAPPKRPQPTDDAMARLRQRYGGSRVAARSCWASAWCG